MENVNVKLDTYKVLTEIVEAGVEKGIKKAKEVTYNPSDRTLIEYITSGVMNNLEKYVKIE